MGKFLVYLSAVLIILLGIPNMAFCIEYINDKTIVRGSPNQLEKEELSSDFGYKITYNLNDGVLSKDNKTIYGLFTPDFTLNNPTKDGYEFIGWTGSNGEIPQLKVTICSGSSSNLEFTANFVLILETPQVEINDNIMSWNAVDNATGYVININGIDRVTTSDLEYNLFDLKNYYIPGNNIIKLKALAQYNTDKYFYSEYSNVIAYTASQLNKPVISINEFNISWDAVKNANEYLVVVGGSEIKTTETSINLLNYQTYISQTGSTPIRVQAVADYSSQYISSSFSDIKYFNTPTLNNVELSLENNILSWTYDENVEYYELYLNGGLCKTIYGLNQIDTMLFASTMQNGNNGFYIMAYAPGYISNKSNTIAYQFVNVAELENLTLEADFSRTSDTYTLDSTNYLDYIQSNTIWFYTNGTYKNFDSYEPYGPDSSEFDNNGCIQVLNYLLDFDRDLYSLRFVGNDPVQAMFEILSIINDNYINGKTTSTINLSGLIKFKIKSTGNYYTPNNISIKIHYSNMFTNSTFKENCVNYLSDFSTNHNISTTYNIISGTNKIDYSSITIKLETVDGSFVYVEYSTHKSFGGYRLNDDSVTENELVNLTSNNKYKLSNGFYFTVNIIELINKIKNTVDSEILNYIASANWTGETLEDIDINDIISVNYEDGTKVTFNYDLKVKYYIFTLY